MEDISDSDSDDELEEAPGFITQYHLHTLNSNSNQIWRGETAPQKISRLDELLAEHREKKEKNEQLKPQREKLLMEIKRGSSDDYTDETTESLASEHADHIEQLEVKTSELNLVHPKLPVFHDVGSKFFCLFTENTRPFSSGFIPSDSPIDKLLASITPDKVPTFLASKILVTCAHQSSCLNRIMLWLLNIMSVHSSPLVVHSCYTNLIDILNQQRIRIRTKGSSTSGIWSPSALDILRLFVNFGADPSKLTESQKAYTKEEIKRHLVKDNDENAQTKPVGNVCSVNVGKVINVVSASLQTRPQICHHELSFIFFMMAKVALDDSLNCSLAKEFQVCFNSIVECYSSNDWPSVVPELCRQLSRITDHHHSQTYLVDLLPVGNRCDYLKIRLSYYFLHELLTSKGIELTDSELEDFRLGDITKLGEPVQSSHVSNLCIRLQHLFHTDLYKTFSAIRLLDSCVGDELYRTSQPREDLEYLYNQVNLVLKIMKDKVSELDISKIKDAMSHLIVKWSLSLQNQSFKQRSIFPWATAASHQPVHEEILQDMKMESDDSS